jgi:GTP cyclohydrolase IA
MTATDHQPPPPAVGNPLPPKLIDVEGIAAATRPLLQALGQLGKVEVMTNTPIRVAQLWAEIVNPAAIDIEIPWKLFENPGYDDLILVTDAHYVSVCEHHLAPAFGVAHFGYVPGKWITGYSKVKKALNYLARQPTLNERLLVEALDTLERVIEPQGVALQLRSMHCCLAMKANAPAQETVTVQGFRGVCREDPYRREFIEATWARPAVFGA